MRLFWLIFSLSLPLFFSHGANAHATELDTSQPVPAKRIIALSPHAVEMLFAIGAGDRVIATTEHADYPENAKSIPRIGGYNGIQLDRLVELQPDLVVVWRGGNRAEDLHKIKQLGFPLFYSEPDTLEKVAVELEQLGGLTGQQERANQVAAAYRQRLGSLRARYQNLAPVPLFYQLWPSPLMTISSESWVHQLIASCGGDNLYADASTPYPQVSIESVLIRAPELIIMPADARAPKGAGITWTDWPQIPAVKNNQLVSIDADLMHRYSPRVLDGIKAVCRAIDTTRQQQTGQEHP